MLVMHYRSPSPARGIRCEPGKVFWLMDHPTLSRLPVSKAKNSGFRERFRPQSQLRGSDGFTPSSLVRLSYSYFLFLSFLGIPLLLSSRFPNFFLDVRGFFTLSQRESQYKTSLASQTVGLMTRRLYHHPFCPRPWANFLTRICACDTKSEAYE